jgi:hypothetical protein
MFRFLAVFRSPVRFANRRGCETTPPSNYSTYSILTPSLAGSLRSERRRLTLTQAIVTGLANPALENYAE